MLLLELTESQKIDLASMPPKDLINEIRSRCSNALDAYQHYGNCLYRGLSGKSSTPLVFKSHSIENRLARDSDPVASKLIDTYMKRMGFKALRSNSIFTTSIIGATKTYGDSYAIFPVNGFDFTFSESQRDIILYKVMMVNDKVQSEIVKIISSKAASETGYLDRTVQIIHQVKAWLAAFKLKDIIPFLKREGLPEEKLTAIKQLLKEIYNKDVMKFYKFNNTDFMLGLELGHEMLIRGEYYALSAKHYGSDISTLIFK